MTTARTSCTVEGQVASTSSSGVIPCRQMRKKRPREPRLSCLPFLSKNSSMSSLLDDYRRVPSQTRDPRVPGETDPTSVTTNWPQTSGC